MHASLEPVLLWCHTSVKISCSQPGPPAGLAVICDMILTTHFMTLVIITVWRLPLVLAAAFYLVFFAIEATFLSSTATKVPTGAASCLCPGWEHVCLAAYTPWCVQQEVFHGKPSQVVHS